MQLRYLQTLAEIGAEQNSTAVFPMPIDIMKPFLEILDKQAKPIGANGAARISHVETAALGVPGTNARGGKSNAASFTELVADRL